MNQKIANIVDISSQYKNLGDVASNVYGWLRHSEFLRYFVVSLIALSLDLGAFSASLRVFGLPWVAAAAIGFAAGLLVAYILSVRFVFAKRKLHQAPFAELLIFSLVGLGGLGVTQIVLWIGIERLQMNPELSKLCAAGFTFIFNFIVRKLMLFNAKSENLA
jgi:putative flippase GtrA